MTAFMCLLILNVLLLIKGMISAFMNLPGRCINTGGREKPAPNQLGPQTKQMRNLKGEVELVKNDSYVSNTDQSPTRS